MRVHATVKDKDGRDGNLAKHNRVDKPPRISGNSLSATGFFMKFRRPKTLGNRPRKAMVCPTKRPRRIEARRIGEQLATVNGFVGGAEMAEKGWADELG
jgi:hypothetical protein